jgi:hypothetical protein
MTGRHNGLVIYICQVAPTDWNSRENLDYLAQYKGHSVFTKSYLLRV